MSAPARPRVLVLGADCPIGLTAVRELGEQGIPVLAHGRSRRALGRYSRFAEDFYEDPRPLAEWLPQLVASRRIGALVAISQQLQFELCGLVGQLGDCRVISPDMAHYRDVLDKDRVSEAARKLGISLPPTWQPKAMQNRASKARSLAYPVALKWPDPKAIWPALAASGLRFQPVEYVPSARELDKVLARYMAIGQWPLVQQYCFGISLIQSLHMHEGKATLRFQHRRLREDPPEGGVSGMCQSVPLSQYQDHMRLSEALLARLGWEGPAAVEYRIDPDSGKAWLMGVDGRLWRSLPLAHQCGVRFVWEAYRIQVLGQAQGEQPAYPVRCARNVVRDLRHLFRVFDSQILVPPGRAATLLRFVLDFLNPKVGYYVFSLKDPRPVLGTLARYLGRKPRPEGPGGA